MGNAICKLWTFLLNLLSNAVEAVAFALKTVGEVVIPILGELGQVISDTVGGTFGGLFSGGSLLLWAGVGLFLYVQLSKDGENANVSEPKGNVIEGEWVDV